MKYLIERYAWRLVALATVLMATGASAATALTVTPAGTAFTADLTASTNWVLTDSSIGLTIVCTVHTMRAITSNPASANINVGSGATNVFSTSAGAPCTYSGFGTGTATITVTATWTITWAKLAAGIATGIKRISGLVVKLVGTLNCTLTWSTSDVSVSYTNSNGRLATNSSNTSMAAGCGTTLLSTEQETLKVSSGITVT